MKILFVVAEFDEKKPVYLKTEAEKGGIFVIDDAELTEKKFYGKLLFQLEQAIAVLKEKTDTKLRPWKKPVKKTITKKPFNTKKK